MSGRDLAIGLLHTLEKPLFRFKAFGAGSVLAPLPRLVRGARYVSIGRRCFIGRGVTLSVWDQYLGVRHTPACDIGDRTMLGRDVVIACTEEIHIGASVTVADRVYIGDSHHGFEDPDVPVLDQPMRGQARVSIGDGCFIGIGAAILPGVTLGERCVVGPNAVVTRSFPPNTVLLGNPARPIRMYDRSKEAWVP